MAGNAQRESSIELLRIIAMLMVMALHVCTYSLKGLESATGFLSSFLPTLWEQAFCICVNLFILISGYFGIRFSVKGLLSILFQCTFYTILIAIATVLLTEGGKDAVGVAAVIRSCLGIPYWFIPCYIILYILSPALEAFKNNVSQDDYRLFLICYFLAQFIYGSIGHVGHFSFGYSTLSFIGLYMLSGYIRQYRPKVFCLPASIDFLIYAGITLLCAFITLQHPIEGDIPYNSPGALLASVYFFLPFTKYHFHSKVVNWLGISSFSIYLIHMNVFVSSGFKYFFQQVFLRFPDYRYFLIDIPILLFFGLSCMLLDKARLLAWNHISIKKQIP